MCALRAPSISVLFLQAFGKEQRSAFLNKGSLGPFSSARRAAIGRDLRSTTTLPIELVRKLSKSSQPRSLTLGLGFNIFNFSLSPKTVTSPLEDNAAKQCTIGVRVTSAPRMFNSQQMLSGRVKIAKSPPRLTISTAILLILEIELSPLYFSGCSQTSIFGAGGRSVQIVSIKF